MSFPWHNPFGYSAYDRGILYESIGTSKPPALIPIDVEVMKPILPKVATDRRGAINPFKHHLGLNIDLHPKRYLFGPLLREIPYKSIGTSRPLALIPINVGVTQPILPKVATDRQSNPLNITQDQTLKNYSFGPLL